MHSTPSEICRRRFLTGSAGTAAAFNIIRPELVRGSGNALLKAGIVGCGGRGTQAITDLLSGNENVELVAMGDIFQDRLERSLAEIRNAKKWPAIQNKIKVDPEHRFIGFDAYKKVLASEIDLVLLTTPPVYRPAYFEAAVEANKHIFAEKPFGVDPPGVRRLMAAAKKSEEKKLSVMAGAQRRSQREYVETVRKIQNGAIGEVVAGYAYWMGGPIIRFPNRPAGMRDLEFQTRDWYAFLWLSGDQVVEQHIHNIDVINWVMGTHPVEVVATGGVAWRPRRPEYGNIYDHLSSDFVYANGVHLSSHCRQYEGNAHRQIGEMVVGTKGRSRCNDMGDKGKAPKVQEHIDLVNSIRGNGPYMNRAMAVADSTMTAIMARESAYSGQRVTWDQIMASTRKVTPETIDYDVRIEVTPPPVPGTYKFI